MDKNLKIAIVEDNDGDAVLIEEMLDYADAEISHFKDIDSALEDFEFMRYDIALVDLGLPGCVGAEAPMMIINENPTLPVIALTGSDDIRIIKKVLSIGAQDYLIKGKFDKDALIRAIRHSIERKKALDNLISQKQLSDNIINTAKAIIMVIDGKFNIVNVNEFFRDITGYRVEEARNKSLIKNYVSLNYQKSAADFFTKCLTTEIDSSCVTRITKKEGGSLFVEWHVSQIKNEYFDISGLLCVGLDMTMKIKAENKLKSNEALLRRTQEIVHVGSWIFDSKTMDFTWTDEVYRIFGLDQSSTKPDYKLYMSFIPEDERDEINAEFTRAINECKPFEKIHSIKRKDGSLRKIHVKAQFEKNRYGKTAKMLGIVHDVTEQKELEEQFRQSQKMEAIGLLAGGIAHDFNNLLMVVLCNCDLILARSKNDDTLTEDIIEIKKSGQRAAELTSQLLAFSRKQVLKPQIIDLNTIVNDLEKMIKRLVGERIDTVAVLEPRISPVKADKGQMDQVIMNLVINARDAMPKGGKITIETKNVKIDDNYIKKYSELKPGSYAMIAVTDTGTGMTKETVDKIFEPFFTTKGLGKGTGLGLSTVYGIVKQSNGYVSCYSEPGRGTCFKIYLPSADAEEYIEKEIKQYENVEPHGEKIVVIDDEKEIRDVVAKMLEQEGFNVFCASSFEDIMKFYETEKIDLLITDVIMPDMNGDEIGEKLLEKYPEAKVIYMSGYTESTIMDFSLLDKNKIYLQKPFSRQSLVENVKEILKN